MAEYEPIVGRYLRLDLDGRRHRLYVEESGQGIPLVCLHTAGADGRQWRHLLTDAEITRHYRDESFAKVEVTPETELDVENKLVHVTVQIRRGPSCHIERIEV